MNITCLIGLHSWGEWTTADACTVVKQCKQCGKATARVHHDWEPWKTVSVCVNQRRCRKCMRDEEQELHTWSNESCPMCFGRGKWGDMEWVQYGAGEGGQLVPTGQEATPCSHCEGNGSYTICSRCGERKL